MEVECSPKGFNWLCLTGTPLYDMDSIFLFHQQHRNCFFGLRVSGWCKARFWFCKAAKMSRYYPVWVRFRKNSPLVIGNVSGHIDKFHFKLL